MPKYLIFPTYESFDELKHLYFVINAPSKDDALSIYSLHFAPHDELLIDDLNCRSATMSFAEQFWLQTFEEKRSLERKGEIVVSDEEFKNRVKEFFAPHSQFAEIYLNYYFSDDDLDSYSWPPEMLVYIFKLNFDDKDFQIINLDSLPNINFN